MGDVGDYWREHKEYKRKAKLLQAKCPCGKCNLWPGQTCPFCGHKELRRKKVKP